MKLQFGKLSANTLKVCGIDEKELLNTMAQAIDIPNSWLPKNLRNETSDSVNAADILKRQAKRKAKRQAQNNKFVNMENEKVLQTERIARYRQQIEQGEEISFEEREEMIDLAYLKCFASFVELGILEPLSEDDCE
jgi:hypothetical protein